jgi:hypothetical protein
MVPAESVLTFRFVLDWDDPAMDLDLYVLGGSGELLCESAMWSLATGNSFTEMCGAGTNPPLAAPETWSIQVLSDRSLDDALPFSVTVDVIAPTRSAIDQAMAARFGDPVRVGTGGDVEASLVIGTDGTMLACSHGAFRKASPLWASEDGGASWREITVTPDPGLSGDCDLAIGGDETWYIVYDISQAGLPPADLRATVASSTDRGATWSVHPVLPQFVMGLDRPWLLADGEEITLFYQQVPLLSPAAHVFARSTDRGQTWPLHTLAGSSDPPERPNKHGGQPISWNNGETVFVPVFSGNTVMHHPGPSWLQYHRSDDSGLTWRTATVLGPHDMPWQITSAARTEDGTIYMAYHTGTVSDGTLHITWSTDDGASWSKPLVIAEGHTQWQVTSAWIDPHPTGGVTVAWMDRVIDGDRPPGWQVAVARIDAGAEEPLAFQGGITEPVDFYQYVEFIMVRHDSDGRAHIAYVMEGEGCADDPTITRSLQCVYMVSERPGTPGMSSE